MKLAVGPFKDMSGYAALARNYVRAIFEADDPKNWGLASVRYDSGSQSEQPEHFNEAHVRFKKDPQSVDCVVQIVTPNEMRGVPGRFNIGICCWETDRIPAHWAMQLNSFDVIVTPCQHNKEAFERSGVNRPIVVIPMPFFADDYKLDDVKDLQIPGINKEEAVVFYNIAQWSHKKGIDALLRSYFLAFQNNENVLLLLKGYVGMHNQQGDAQKIMGAIQEVKNAMKLHKYPRVYVTDRVTDEDGVKQIHKYGDCYASFTRGEGWGIPPIEALLYGNDLITPDHTAMSDWLKTEGVRDSVYIVDSYEDSVHNMPHPDEQLYTSRENWFEPKVLSGVEAFRKKFSELRKNTKETRQALFSAYAPKKIGKQLVEVMSDAKV